MRARVLPGGRVEGESTVPGDKSISHRWLLLAATARGTCRLAGLPRSLDVLSTAGCLAQLVPPVRPALEAWASGPVPSGEHHGSTWNRPASTLEGTHLELHGEGRGAAAEPARSLDCGNSGTSIRLLAGVVASRPFTTVLIGDESLSRRPMERVARPLRDMGAEVRTSDGHPPVTVRGSELHGISFRPERPSAQVKGAVLLAGADAQGATTIVEAVATRDHTERALEALGAAVRLDGGNVVVDGPFQHEGFAGRVPGDPSAAAFLLGAASLSGSPLTISDVGLNPSRLRFLEVFRRMGIATETEILGSEVGEPFGTIHLRPGGELRSVRVGPDELPLVVDEVPILAALVVHAAGESRFEGGAELRVKESDRLTNLVKGIRGLGGEAAVDGDDLVVAGGGLEGGSANAGGDHRIAMALCVSALAASAPAEIDGMGSAEISFPGFMDRLATLGARLEGFR